MILISQITIVGVEPTLGRVDLDIHPVVPGQLQRQRLMSLVTDDVLTAAIVKELKPNCFASIVAQINQQPYYFVSSNGYSEELHLSGLNLV